MSLEAQELALDRVLPNPWNPNRQTDRQYQAEVESILTYGFIDPITVRPHPSKPGHWEIVDGEHRWKALLDLLKELPDTAHPSLKALHKRRTIPAVVLEVADYEAKKLTIALNETRGTAEILALKDLLTELAEVEGEALRRALPYEPRILDRLLASESFDWDNLPSDATLDAEQGVIKVRLAFNLTEEQYARWEQVVQDYRASAPDEWPADPREGHLLVLEALLDRFEEVTTP